MNELFAIAYSPWSEKARWALDARRVPYRERPYAPILGELALRARLRRPRGLVSVPVLIPDRGPPLTDSLSIARWASSKGEGPDLFPAHLEDDVLESVAASERALDAGRALSLLRVRGDREALLDLVPRPMRGPLGPLAPSIAEVGVVRTLRKYGAHRTSAGQHREALRRELEAMRALVRSAPKRGGAVTLYGDLTFADIALSQALVFVAPPASGLRIGRATRRAFTDEELARKFADLLAWRDRLYAAHRGSA